MRAVLLGLTVLAGIMIPRTGEAAPMKVTAALAAGERVVTVAGLGDSITGVYYHTGGRRAWTEMLGVALQRVYPQAKLKTVNAGISGNISQNGVERLDRDVLVHEPDLVVVMFGMNDVARVTPEAYEANLRQIVERCRAAGAEVVLCTPNFIDTDAARPVDKLRAYAEIVRKLAQELAVPLADCFAAYERVHDTAARAWRALMSDAIHPNMRGHEFFAEEITRVITGQQVSLADVGPIVPGLPHVRKLLEAGQPLRVRAMPPYDKLVTAALQARYPNAQIEMLPWETEGQSLAQIEAQAKAQGWMAMREKPELPRPHLVVIAVPAQATAPDFDAFYRHYTWIMNWSQSFGQTEWDVVVMLPSVADPAQVGTPAETDALLVVTGQDLPYLQRQPGQTESAETLLQQWVNQQLGE